MSDRKLGVLLLSCVRHQRDYAPLFAKHPDLTIVAVADEPDSPEWMRAENRAFAARYGVPFVEDVDAALARADVDIASVASEPTRHARLAERAALAGKHVWCDKPLATTVEAADRVVAAVEASGVTLTYVHRLFSPAIRRARAAVDRGDVGLPYALHLTWISHGGLTSGSVEDFRLVVDRTLSGGGELMNFLGYPVDTARYLTGLDVRSVWASAGTHFFEPHREHGVEDFGVVCLTLDRGVTATAVVGRSPAPRVGGMGDLQARIHGSNGTLLVDEHRPRLTVAAVPDPATGAAPPPARGLTPPTPTLFDAQLDDFLAAIRDRRPPLRTVRDGRALVAVLTATYRSLKSGQVEPVE